MPRFSDRIPPDLTPNALARARERAGDVPFDLTISNPTRCGLPYPSGLLAPLASDEGLTHAPDPAGLASARRAVAADYARRGVEVDPDRVVLTASTSEAYALLFKLLGNPGEHVAVPFPSYPLLQHLVALEGLVPLPYRLAPHDGFQPDVPSLARADVRAIVVVHPNNPTGSYIARDTAERLLDLCEARDCAIIVDEVFFDFPLDAHPFVEVTSFASNRRALSFTLGGLSKQVGLPQLKLAWILVGGEPAAAEQALERLTFIADQYLSVAAPVQLALESLLRDGASVRVAILERCRRNVEALARAVESAGARVTLLRPEGGWNAVLRFPATIDEEQLALALLEQDGVAVHPGYLFDFETDGHVVLSLLPEPAVFDEGVLRLLRRW